MSMSRAEARQHLANLALYGRVDRDISIAEFHRSIIAVAQLLKEALDARPAGWLVQAPTGDRLALSKPEGREGVPLYEGQLTDP